MSTCCFKFKRLLGAFATCTALAVVAYAPSAFATVVSDNSLLELDTGVANTVDPNCSGSTCNSQPSAASALPDDWNDLGPNGTSTDLVKLGTSHADVATGIIVDEPNTARVFSQGSKDEADISSWAFRVGSSPPKGDMTHAYAAGYEHDSSGASIPLILFFGSNRASFNGTTENGYWFFKQRIFAVDASKGFFSDAAGTIPAHHCDGDLLVTVAYDNGGKIGTVRVRKWVDAAGSGACSGTGTLTDVVNSTNSSGISGRFCNPAETICAGSNSATITLPWAPGEGSAGQFLEGGLDVFGLTGEKPCFASFMATSRSSTTTKSETKNFILRDFPVCKLDVTKACTAKELVPVTNPDGTTGFKEKFTVNGIVTNSGGGTLSSITVIDAPPLETGSLGFFACDSSGQPTGSPISNPSLDPGATICYSGTILGPLNTPTFDDTIKAQGSSGGATITSPLATATCSVPIVGIPTLTKDCVTCLDDSSVSGKVVLDTSYSGQVCNPNNFPFVNVKVKDFAEDTDSAFNTTGIVVKDTSGTEVQNATLTSFTLPAATSAGPTCFTYTGTYFPAHALKKSPATGTTLNPDKAQFRDEIQVRGQKPFGLPDQLLVSKPASCDLCINPTSARCGD